MVTWHFHAFKGKGLTPFTQHCSFLIRVETQHGWIAKWKSVLFPDCLFFVFVVVSVVCVALSSPKTSHNCPSTSKEVEQRQFPAPDFEQMNEVAFSFSGSDSLSHSLSPSLKEITQRLLIFVVWSIAKVGGKFLAVCWKLVGR